MNDRFIDGLEFALNIVMNLLSQPAPNGETGDLALKNVEVILKSAIVHQVCGLCHSRLSDVGECENCFGNGAMKP